MTISYMLNFNQASTKERCSFHRIYLKPSNINLPCLLMCAEFLLRPGEKAKD
jgi:hypothetical protein